MQKVIILIILTNIIFSNLSFGESIIFFKIKNAEDNTISYSYNEPVIHNNVYDDISLNKDSMKLKIDNIDPVLISFVINDYRLTYLLLPNDSLFFEVDANNISNSLKYHCSNMMDQQYTLELAAIESKLFLGLKPYKVKGTGWENFPENFMDSMRMLENIDKEKFYRNNNSNVKWSNYLKTNIIDTSYKNALNIYNRKLFSNIQIGDMTLKSSTDEKEISTEAFNKILDSMIIERPDLIRNNIYMEFLYFYNSEEYNKWFESKGLDNNEWLEYMVDFQNEHYKNDTVKYAIMTYFNGKNNSNSPEIYSNQLRKIEKIFPNGVYNSKMKEIESSLQSLSKGKKAPEFSLKNHEGKVINLNDYLGKVVYIDFWASWCFPCIAENKAVKIIKPKYKDKDVIFLYITRDESEKIWIDAIKNQEIDGIHLMGGNDEVFDKYKANGVPKYVLIDKKGYIISSNAPRPSERENLEAMIDKALTE